MMAVAVVIVGLAFCLVLWVGWMAFLSTLDTTLQPLHPAIERYLRLLEQRHAPPQGTSSDKPIPDDIVAHILSTRRAQWAQEQEMDFAREKYREYGQWPPVRVLMGIGIHVEGDS